MTSITKILILITAITAISGKAIDFSTDTNQTSDWISYSDKLLDMLSRLKLTTPQYDELDILLPMWTKLYVLPPSPNTDNTTNTQAIVSQQGNGRERRQAPVKTREEDDGSDSVTLLASSSHPFNVARFPNGDIVDYATINLEVKKWIRQQLKIDMLQRIQKAMLKHRNRRSSSKADISSNENITTSTVGTNEAR